MHHPYFRYASIMLQQRRMDKRFARGLSLMAIFDTRKPEQY
jgi:hypothetical protein